MIHLYYYEVFGYVWLGVTCAVIGKHGLTVAYVAVCLSASIGLRARYGCY